MSEAPKIDTIGHEVLEMQAAARVCRTTFEGIESMREAGETYLPKNPRENPNDYKLRLGLTDFFPALQKAVHVYIGKPLGSPIVVTGSPVEKFLDDVDLQGNDLDTWTRCNLTAGLVDGEVFAVAEYHKVAPGLNLAQERALGARPYLLHIPVENLIDFREEMINGVKKMVHFRYFECHRAPNGRWGSSEVRRIRVLEPGQVEVWEEQTDKDGKTVWVLLPELSGAVSLQDVPVARYRPRLDDEPPLTELAWLNVRHWQSKSEQNHILHAARVPLLAADGDNREDTLAPVEIGVKGLITGFPNLHYVEIQGGSIEAGRQDILDTEDRMRRVAGQALDMKVKTATESTHDAKDNESQLRAWICSYQDYLEQCLRLMSLWLRQDNGGTVALDMDWEEAEVGADVLTALSNMRAKGQISQNVLFHNLKKAEIIPPDMTLEEEQARLESEAPDLAPIPPRGKPAPKKATITRPDGTTSTVSMG